MSKSKAILSDDGTGCVFCSKASIVTAINKQTSMQRPGKRRRDSVGVERGREIQVNENKTNAIFLVPVIVATYATLNT